MSSKVTENDLNVSDWESDEEENEKIKDLFSDKIFSSVMELITVTKEVHNFDIAEIVKEFGDEDEISIIMLVNFIRSSVASCDGDINAMFIDQLKSTILRKEFLNKEEYMIPFIQDDSLLFLLGEALVNFDENKDEKGEDEGDWDTTVSKFSFFSKVSGTKPDVKQDTEKVEQIRAVLEGEDEPSDYYFGGYSHVGIHETMLRDAARTNAYADAFLKNKEFVKDKVVLDVGCGTGILCLFAAKAGAKKVIGVDMSSIIERSKKLVEKNGYSDVITLVRGRLEDIELPLAAGEVDIIVSEWMGYGLYFENMLPAVMYAKEKYLRQDNGVVMPSDAVLFIEAVTAESHDDDRVSWWNDVYGFDMTVMTDLFTAEAQVDVVSQDCIVSNRARIHALYIAQAKDEDLDFDVPFSMIITDERARTHGVKAFVISFDVLFGGIDSKWTNITLTTSVQAVPTHWKQTALWLSPENVFTADVGDEVVGTVHYRRSESNDRDYVIEISCCHSKGTVKFSQKYMLGS